MKTQHDGDCSIYACLSNNIPEAGICTCGYGHQLRRGDGYSKMYSEELEQKLEIEGNLNKGKLKEFIVGLKQKTKRGETKNLEYLKGLIKFFERN